MKRYVKVSREVAENLNLLGIRRELKDGAYLLWQGDFMSFGSLSQLEEIAASIGGICLTTKEAKEEVAGTVLRPLPYNNHTEKNNIE